MSDPDATIVSALITAIAAIACELIKRSPETAGTKLPLTTRFRPVHWGWARNLLAFASLAILLAFIVRNRPVIKVDQQRGEPNSLADQRQGSCQIYGVSDSCLNELRTLYAGVMSPDLTGILATGRDGLPPVYRVGESITIAFQSTRDAYYLLLDRKQDGKYQTIAPLGNDPDQVRMQEVVGLPRSDSDHLWVDGPPGSATLVLILSNVPVQQLLAARDPSQYNFAIVELPYWINP